MNRFELFCMVYFVLDAAWEDTKDPMLADYLSGANPFLFTDISSADPAVYERFCERVSDSVPLEDSYGEARAYVDSLGNAALSNAFSELDEAEWTLCVRDYLAQEHKGTSAESSQGNKA